MWREVHNETKQERSIEKSSCHFERPLSDLTSSLKKRLMRKLKCWADNSQQMHPGYLWTLLKFQFSTRGRFLEFISWCSIVRLAPIGYTVIETKTDILCHIGGGSLGIVGCGRSVILWDPHHSWIPKWSKVPLPHHTMPLFCGATLSRLLLRFSLIVSH